MRTRTSPASSRLPRSRATRAPTTRPSNKLAACAKHYVAYGGTEGGRDYNTVDVSIEQLHNQYLPPFKAAVEAGVATVMASFNTIAGVPAHANVYTLRDVLKDSLRLRRLRGQRLHRHPGTDQARRGGQRRGRGGGRHQRRRRHGDGVHQLRRHTASRCWPRGRITQAQIDDAVHRILRIKFALGPVRAPLRGRVRRGHHGVGRPPGPRPHGRRLAAWCCSRTTTPVLPLAPSASGSR